MPKKPRVRRLIDSQHVKGFKTLVKTAWQYFCHIFWSFWNEIRLKMSALVVSEILRLFVIDTRWQVFSFTKSQCLTQQIQMQLFSNQKIFAKFFSAFLNVHKFLNTLKKKDEPKRLLSFKMKNCKKRA